VVWAAAVYVFDNASTDRTAEVARAAGATVTGVAQRGKGNVVRRMFADVEADIYVMADGDGTYDAGAAPVMIARLLGDPPHVLATGGGAFMNPDTRALIKSRAISVWLKADLEVLARRVGRKESRPLLKDKDPLAVLQEQAALRYPAYGEADVIVETGDAAHHVTVDQVIRALTAYLEEQAR